jgi:nicotinamide phosphoribosyltransferase
MKIQALTVNPLTLADFYKYSHILMYPPKTERVFSTWTPRDMSKFAGNADGVVVFGVQAALMTLHEIWDTGFFGRPLNQVFGEFEHIYNTSLGTDVPPEWINAIHGLHALGHLPIEVRALSEGTLCPCKVPYLTITNVDPRFGWLTNFLETMLSTSLWLPASSATQTYYLRKLVNKYAVETGLSEDDMNFTLHDFSMRGMANIEAGMSSGAAHLLSSWGTDTISAFNYIKAYYNGELGEDYQAFSVPASEHSVMSAWGPDNERELFEWLLTERFPSGILSVVSDTWDLWKVIGEYLPGLRDTVMKRDGKLVIRPDSGDPVHILCGDPDGETEIEKKGAVEALWNIFGGVINQAGYKTLDPHIGLIYGDAINYTRAGEILKRLKAKGFAANNVVFGIGSYTYQYQTRDTFGFALKSTAAVVDGTYREIFKDPATDRDSVKKSQRGFVGVSDKLALIDKMSPEKYRSFNEHGLNALGVVYRDGQFLRVERYSDIRDRLWSEENHQ